MTVAKKNEIKKLYHHLRLFSYLLPEVCIHSLGCTRIYVVIRWRVVNKNDSFCVKATLESYADKQIVNRIGLYRIFNLVGLDHRASTRQQTCSQRG